MFRERVDRPSVRYVSTRGDDHAVPEHLREVVALGVASTIAALYILPDRAGSCSTTRRSGGSVPKSGCRSVVAAVAREPWDTGSNSHTAAWPRPSTPNLMLSACNGTARLGNLEAPRSLPLQSRETIGQFYPICWISSFIRSAAFGGIFASCNACRFEVSPPT